MKATAKQVVIWISEQGQDQKTERHYKVDTLEGFAAKQVVEIAGEQVKMDKYGFKRVGSETAWFAIYKTKSGRVFDVWEDKELAQ